MAAPFEVARGRRLASYLEGGGACQEEEESQEGPEEVQKGEGDQPVGPEE